MRYSPDAPEGQKPGMPINVTVDAVSGGWVIRYGQIVVTCIVLYCYVVNVMYFTVMYKFAVNLYLSNILGY